MQSLAFADEYHSEERVRKGAEKLSKHLNAKQQGRLDGFFSVAAKPKEDAKGKGAKGKKDDAKKGGKRKVSFTSSDFWRISI